MKIAFVAVMNGFPWGGSEELWSTTAREALREGHRVIVIVFDWGRLHPRVQELVNEGVHLHLRKRNPAVAAFPLRLLRRLRQVASPNREFAALREFGPDVVCVSQGGTYDLYYERELQRFLSSANVPYCLVCQFNHETGVLSPAERQGARRLFTAARRVFFVAERNLRTARRQMACALDHATVVANPVNLSATSVVSWPTGEKVKFASVARLQAAFKGQDLLLEVLGGEVWKTRNWELNLYGSGPNEAYLKELAVFFGIGDQIHFRGQAADIREVWAGNHLLVLPSVGEGLPLSLVEAMLCGRPAVVTDVGDSAAVIEEPATGFVAEAASVRSFGAALERAWRARAAWPEMGVRAHRVATGRTDFTPGKTLLAYLIG